MANHIAHSGSGDMNHPIYCEDCCRHPPVGNGPHQITPFVIDERWYQARCHECIARHGFTGSNWPVSEAVEIGA